MQHLDIELAHMLLSGKLSAADEARWKRHADQCARCRDLLAHERSMMKVLELGEAPPRAAEEDRLSEALGVIPQFAAEAATRRRRRYVQFSGTLLAVIGLALLLAWQLRGRAVVPRALAQELHISPAMQREVMSKLDLLLTLQQEPWLATEYEAVCTFEQLVLNGRPP